MSRYEPVELAGRRALVVGLGRHGGGIGVTRYLVGRGARVTVTDVAEEAHLARSVERLADLDDVSFVLGTHEGIDVAAFDLVVRNAAIRDDHPLLVAARVTGRTIHSEATLLVRDFPGTVVAVTGSKGKTSTCYFLAHLLGGENAGVRLVGNMGGSALEGIDRCDPTSTAVWEASSFQVEALAEAALSVPVAVLTGLHPDHLDRYGNVATYYASKAPLFDLQRDDDWRVMPAPEDLPVSFAEGARGRRVCVGRDDPSAEFAVWVEDAEVLVRVRDGAVLSLAAIPQLGVDVSHGVGNAITATGVALALGHRPEVLRARLATLPPVPHRMELVPSVDGRRWINDTAATNPTAAGAGIGEVAAGGDTTVICGGASKGLDPAPLIDALVRTRPHIVLLAGAETDRIAAELSVAAIAVVGTAGSMDEAVELAAGAGDRTVLLSPGCSSFGMFTDEFDRGARFIAAVVRRDGRVVDDDLLARFADPRHQPLAELLSWE